MTLGHLLYMHMYQITFLSPLGFKLILIFYTSRDGLGRSFLPSRAYGV